MATSCTFATCGCSCVGAARHNILHCTSIDQTSTRFDHLLSDVCLLLLACYVLVPPVLLWAAAAAAAETLLFALRSLLREGRGGCLPLVALWQPSCCWSSLLHCQLEKPFVTHIEQNTSAHTLTHVHAQRMKKPTDRVVFHAAHISSASASSASALRSYLWYDIVFHSRRCRVTRSTPRWLTGTSYRMWLCLPGRQFVAVQPRLSPSLTTSKLPSPSATSLFLRSKPDREVISPSWPPASPPLSSAFSSSSSASSWKEILSRIVK